MFQTTKYYIKSTTFHLKYNIIIRIIYIIIYTQKRKYIPTSNHLTTICSIQFSTLEFTPLGSLDLSAFRPRRVASTGCVASRSSLIIPIPTHWGEEGHAAKGAAAPGHWNPVPRRKRRSPGLLRTRGWEWRRWMMGMEKMCLITLWLFNIAMENPL